MSEEDAPSVATRGGRGRAGPGGATGRRRPAAASAHGRSAGDPPNVVLVVMDTARAGDVLGRRDVMPNLHRIAAEGVTYTQAFATAPWTLPSHASIFTGQYTTDHGTHAGSRRFDPAVPTLAERLSAAGYRTAAFSNNTWVSPGLGFDRGFDEFRVGWELLAGGADLPSIAAERDGLADQARAVGRRLLARDGHRTLCNALYAKFLRKRYDDGAWLTNRRVARWLRRRAGDRPFFLFVNYLEPHLAYRPPRGYRDRFLPPDVSPAEAARVDQDAWAYLAGEVELDERDFRVLRGLYRGELRYLDARIGRLYDRLRAAGELEDTVFAVVGDHGENVGEHGLMDHQYCLYDTLLHVPVVIRYPAEARAASGTDGGSDSPSSSGAAAGPAVRRPLPARGREHDGLVELRDLYPHLLALAGLDPTDSPTVASHDALLDGGRDRVLAEYVTPQPSIETLRERVGGTAADLDRFDRGLRSLRTPTWKYVEGTDGSRELYALADDPGETDDVAADHPAVADELAAELHRRRGEMVPPDRETGPPLDQDARRRLQELGYLQ